MENKENLRLTDPDIYPDEMVLKAALGSSYDAFLELMKLYENNEMVYEWRYYSDGKAWLCKVQFKKRTIVWMSVWKGYAQATMYFPLRYLDDILGLKISAETRESIMNTKNVGKSKPCTFEIRNKKILNDFEEVMKFKMVAK